jgi:hypothetical protein
MYRSGESIAEGRRESQRIKIQRVNANAEVLQDWMRPSIYSLKGFDASML